MVLNKSSNLCENFGGYVGRACDGGYAEYIKLPAKNFVPIPETLDIYKITEIGVICDAVRLPIRQRGRISASTFTVFRPEGDWNSNAQNG